MPTHNNFENLPCNHCRHVNVGILYHECRGLMDVAALGCIVSLMTAGYCSTLLPNGGPVLLLKKKKLYWANVSHSSFGHVAILLCHSAWRTCILWLGIHVALSLRARTQNHTHMMWCVRTSCQHMQMVCGWVCTVHSSCDQLMSCLPPENSTSTSHTSCWSLLHFFLYFCASLESLQMWTFLSDAMKWHVDIYDVCKMDHST